MPDHLNQANAQDDSSARDADSCKPAVSVLVVGYKSRGYIARCFEGAIKASAGCNAEFMFIDCSDDGSADLLAEKFPSVRVLPFQGNLGFARGNNVLAQHARGDKLLLLNPDVFCERDEIRALLQFADEEFADGYATAGAWGSVTVLPNGEVDGGCTQTMLGVLSAFLVLVGLGSVRPGALRPHKLTPQRVPVLTGAFMLVRADLWRTLGGLDERYFMYAEEVDLCHRIASLGFEIWADPRIRVLHDTGSGAPKSGNRLVQLCTGNATFFDKHLGPLSSWIAKSLMWLNALTRFAWGWIRRKPDYLEGYGAVLGRRREWWNGWPTERAAPT
jgi:N-acetylglucosaminyl-diphospho-decaprenol L-rhamnosyltransferase